MAEITYILCAVTSVGAAMILLVRYRQLRTALLFWSAVAFIGLALNNVLVVVDFIMAPHIDLSPTRAIVAAAAMLVFVAGLISETA